MPPSYRAGTANAARLARRCGALHLIQAVGETGLT
jgi:hypothetical protein